MMADILGKKIKDLQLIFVKEQEKRMGKLKGLENIAKVKGSLRIILILSWLRTMQTIEPSYRELNGLRFNEIKKCLPDLVSANISAALKHLLNLKLVNRIEERTIITYEIHPKSLDISKWLYRIMFERG